MTVTRHTNREISHFRRDYRIAGKLRSGGMGRVYLAIMEGPLNTQQKVVMKLPLNIRDGFKYRRDFENEARVMAQLNHPNIIRSIDWTQLDGAPCMVTEYIEGFELRDIIRVYNSMNQRIPLNVVVQIMLQVCEAMQYVHTAKAMDGSPLHIVHRDIDASNIMIADDGYVKIIDFGIAKNTMQDVITRPGVYKGKIANLPPDVFIHSRADHRADIFSLGIMMYEMLTGKRPRQFEEVDSITRIVEVIKTREIPGPSDSDSRIPDVFDHIVLKATRLNREERYRSAAEMFNDLRAISRTYASGPAHMPVRKWMMQDLASLRERRDAKLRNAVENAVSTPIFSKSAGSGIRRYNQAWKWQNTLRNQLVVMKLYLKQWLPARAIRTMARGAALVSVFAATVAITLLISIGQGPGRPQHPSSVQVRTETDEIRVDNRLSPVRSTSAMSDRVSDQKGISPEESDATRLQTVSATCQWTPHGSSCNR